MPSHETLSPREGLSPREQAIRRLLKVPTEARTVLFLTQNSHLDWDWLATFRGYLNGDRSNNNAVNEILSKAFELMRAGKPSPSQIPYYYSIAEVGFLKAFIESNPQELEDFDTAIGSQLRVVGGGITSPDNLLPHGEAYLRNHLLGALWVREVLGLPTSDAWLPDDFGSDAQLPVLIRALGLRSVAFSRVAGISQGNQGDGVTPPPGTPARTLIDEGVDLYWQARDGSTVLGHYMQASYCQGNDIAASSYPSLSAAQQAVTDHIDGYLRNNQSASSTNYVFVPVGCDFSMPVETRVQGTSYDLRDFADWWNQTRYSSSSNPVWAVAASYDFYAELVDSTTWKSTAVKTPRTFYSTPYWTGFYASRPELKILHQRATRALLAAETYGILADARAADDAARWQATVEDRDARLRAGWLDLAPSTHHDYITGTANGYAGSPSPTDLPVYPDEQVPQLWNAVRSGESLGADALQVLAASIDLRADDPGNMPVAVANPLGWARTEVVEMASMPYGMIRSSGTSANDHVQETADESTLFVADVGACGYSLATLALGTPSTHPVDGAVSLTASGGQWILRNGLLAATIGQTSIGDQSDYAVVALQDLTSGAAVLPAGRAADTLQFFEDTGGLYQFGNENYNGDGPNDGGQCTTCMTLTNPASRSLGDVEVLETGPLRARLRTTVTVTDARGDSYDYLREYTLRWNEPFVRVRSVGSAPRGFSVATGMALADTPSALEYGTTYHWDDASPTAGWDLSTAPAGRINPPIVQVCHDFVLPYAGDAPAFAVYQDSLLAWTQSDDLAGAPALFAIAWRNPTGNDGRGATGYDSWIHEHHYALRVPSGLGDAASGQPLQESRAMQTPLRAVLVSSSSDSTLPTSRSVASITSVSSGSVLLTAAKGSSRCPGEIVLRIYKPADGTNPRVTVAFDRDVLGGWPADTPLAVRGVTALETDLSPEENAALDLETTADGFSFTPTYALTTLAVGGHCGGYGSGLA